MDFEVFPPICTSSDDGMCCVGCDMSVHTEIDFDDDVDHALLAGFVRAKTLQIRDRLEILIHKRNQYLYEQNRDAVWFSHYSNVFDLVHSPGKLSMCPLRDMEHLCSLSPTMKKTLDDAVSKYNPHDGDVLYCLLCKGMLPLRPPAEGGLEEEEEGMGEDKDRMVKYFFSCPIVRRG